ncbi:hypothetical protein CSW00_03070 [Pseudomonas asiatica]|nr:hypothetical protein CSW00_03070 [Pseudomonas sp. MR 02]
MAGSVARTNLALDCALVPCGSGLVSRKGCAAAPGYRLRSMHCRGRCAALSRHKAAPTKIIRPRHAVAHFSSNAPGRDAPELCMFSMLATGQSRLIHITPCFPEL